MFFLIIFLINLKKGLNSFSKWNWITVFSLILLLFIILLIIFQICFKEKTKFDSFNKKNKIYNNN